MKIKIVFYLVIVLVFSIKTNCFAATEKTLGFIDVGKTYNIIVNKDDCRGTPFEHGEVGAKIIKKTESQWVQVEIKGKTYWLNFDHVMTVR